MGQQVTIGHHYYDPENERIVVFLGMSSNNFMSSPTCLQFREFETGKEFYTYEFEMAEEWPHMNEMEVLAWASK